MVAASFSSSSFTFASSTDAITGAGVEGTAASFSLASAKADSSSDTLSFNAIMSAGLILGTSGTDSSSSSSPAAGSGGGAFLGRGGDLC